jgi:hypothetical protein
MHNNMLRFRGYVFSNRKTDNSKKFSGIFSRKIIPENFTSLLITPHLYNVSGWLLNVPLGLPVKNSTFCLYYIYMFCVDIRTVGDYYPVEH